MVGRTERANRVTLLELLLGLLLIWLCPANLPAQAPAKIPVAEVKADEKKPQEKPAEDKKEAKVAEAVQVQVLALPAVAIDVAMAEGEVVETQVADNPLEGNIAGAVRPVDPAIAKLVSRVAVDNATVRRICKPNEQQLERLKNLDAKWVSEKAKKAPVAGNAGGGFIRAVVGGLVGGRPVQQMDPAAASTAVIEEYRKELQSLLSKEQLAEFEAAIAERERFRRRANAECVVALLDDRLFLSHAQREELASKLEDWKGIQHLQPHFYFQNHSYIPTLPAEVAKVLNESQRKLFQSMQQVDFQGGNFGVEDAVFIDN